MRMLTCRYITFDCYGTLTKFRIGESARARMADRIDALPELLGG